MTRFSEPIFYILLAISRGPRHGYAILQDTEESTGGRVRLRTATLYTTLRRLVDRGLVTETAGIDKEGDERRRYYALTPSGAAELDQQTERLRQMVQLSDGLVGGGGRG